jgi:hypothetical protein
LWRAKIRWDIQIGKNRFSDTGWWGFGQCRPESMRQRFDNVEFGTARFASVAVAAHLRTVNGI